MGGFKLPKSCVVSNANVVVLSAKSCFEQTKLLSKSKQMKNPNDEFIEKGVLLLF